jgi:WD40 repeat protein
VDKARELPGAEWAKRPAMSVLFSHDGKRLLTGRPGKGALQIYNVGTGKQERVVEAAIGIRMLTLSKDGKQLATSHGAGAPQGAGSIQVWDTTTWKERAALRGVASLCLGIDFSPDGKLLAGASTQGTVQLFDVTVSPMPRGAVKIERGAVRDQAK